MDSDNWAVGGQAAFGRAGGLAAVRCHRERTAAPDPVPVIRGSAGGLPLRRIPDVRVNLLELSSGADVPGDAGAVQ